jgi:hypothetical protein
MPFGKENRMKKVKITLADLRELRLPQTRFEVKELVNTVEFEIGQGLTLDEVNEVYCEHRISQTKFTGCDVD